MRLRFFDTDMNAPCGTGLTVELLNALAVLRFLFEDSADENNKPVLHYLPPVEQELNTSTLMRLSLQCISLSYTPQAWRSCERHVVEALLSQHRQRWEEYRLVYAEYSREAWPKIKKLLLPWIVNQVFSA